MPRFEYIAVDSQGEQHSGRIDAPSEDRARAMLTSDGWTVQTLLPVPEAAPTELSNADFASGAERSLSLLTSLRALSEDLPSARVRVAIREMADRIERGESVPIAFAAVRERLPVSMQMLLSLGLDHGRIDVLLSDYLDHTRRLSDIRTALWMSLAYPGFLIAAVVGLCVAISWFVMPVFAEIYQDFGLELPGITLFLLQASDFVRERGLIALLVIGGLVLAGWYTLRLIGGPVLPQSVFRGIPCLGRVFRWASLASCSETLAMLIDLQTPLPTAFRTAARITDDLSIAQGLSQAASEIEAGIAATNSPSSLPRELGGSFRWANQPALLADSLRSSSEIFSARSRVELYLTRWLLEPLVLFVVAVSIGVAFIALFLPLVRLLNGLA